MGNFDTPTKGCMEAFDSVVCSGLIVAYGKSRWTDSGLVERLFLDVPDPLLHQRLSRRLVIQRRLHVLKARPHLVDRYTQSIRTIHIT